VGQRPVEDDVVDTVDELWREVFGYGIIDQGLDRWVDVALGWVLGHVGSAKVAGHHDDGCEELTDVRISLRSSL
jgi:hypothetical protein